MNSACELAQCCLQTPSRMRRTRKQLARHKHGRTSKGARGVSKLEPSTSTCRYTSPPGPTGRTCAASECTALHESERWRLHDSMRPPVQLQSQALAVQRQAQLLGRGTLASVPAAARVPASAARGGGKAEHVLSRPAAQQRRHRSPHGPHAQQVARPPPSPGPTGGALEVVGGPLTVFAGTQDTSSTSKPSTWSTRTPGGAGSVQAGCRKPYEGRTLSALRPPLRMPAGAGAHTFLHQHAWRGVLRAPCGRPCACPQTALPPPSLPALALPAVHVLRGGVAWTSQAATLCRPHSSEC